MVRNRFLSPKVKSFEDSDSTIVSLITCTTLSITKTSQLILQIGSTNRNPLCDHLLIAWSPKIAVVWVLRKCLRQRRPGSAIYHLKHRLYLYVWKILHSASCGGTLSITSDQLVLHFTGIFHVTWHHYQLQSAVQGQGLQQKITSLVSIISKLRY